MYSRSIQNIIRAQNSPCNRHPLQRWDLDLSDVFCERAVTVFKHCYMQQMTEHAISGENQRQRRSSCSFLYSVTSFLISVSKKKVSFSAFLCDFLSRWNPVVMEAGSVGLVKKVSDVYVLLQLISCCQTLQKYQNILTFLTNSRELKAPVSYNSLGLY